MARPPLPPTPVRSQGGGVANIVDEAAFAAISCVLVTGFTWRPLPPCFGALKPTVHRRFLIWYRGRLHQKVLKMLAGQDLVDLPRRGPPGYPDRGPVSGGAGR
ncbi:transposase [Streptomyces sp. NPDC058683]|uniref:transposase n=1 Tax=Streptomyces sp. NPDC058683 TaxID=3346597 RepID=UPI00364A5CB9